MGEMLKNIKSVNAKESRINEHIFWPTYFLAFVKNKTITYDWKG